MRQTQYNIPLFVLTILMFASLHAHAQESQAFESAENQIALSHPAQWTRMEEPPAPLVLMAYPGIAEPTDTDFAEVVSLVVTKVEKEGETAGTLRNFVAGYLDNARKREDFKLLETKDVKLGGVVAKYIVYQRKVAGRLMKTACVLAVREQRAYALLLSGDPDDHDKLQPEFQKVVRSVRWISRTKDESEPSQ